LDRQQSESFDPSPLRMRLGLIDRHTWRLAADWNSDPEKSLSLSQIQ
jgi:hypothetical protein